jgi:hypothetical protein
MDRYNFLKHRRLHDQGVTALTFSDKFGECIIEDIFGVGALDSFFAQRGKGKGTENIGKSIPFTVLEPPFWVPLFEPVQVKILFVAPVLRIVVNLGVEI